MKIRNPHALLQTCLMLFVCAQITRAQFAATKPILEPTLFAPGVISTGDYESHPVFTADGKTLYFLKDTPDFNFWTIVLSRFEKGKWNEPQVATFSGQYSDADPFITDDGKRMFFISRRPVTIDISPNAAGRLDIWMMDKTEKGDWSEPRNLGAPVNSEASEFFPTLTDEGTLYFGSGRKGGKGGIDLYRSRLVNGKYQEPENLGDAINTEFDEFEPFIAPDESFLIFMAGGRPDGLGGFDLYLSYNRDAKWTKPQNLGAPINSAADELSPKITSDGRYFFWTSTRSNFSVTGNKPFTSADFFRRLRSAGNGLGDIYYLDASMLKIEPPSGLSYGKVAKEKQQEFGSKNRIVRHVRYSYYAPDVRAAYARSNRRTTRRHEYANSISNNSTAERELRFITDAER